MANNISTFLDFFGVDWPLGFVAVAAIGTPVNIMNNVDPTNKWAGGTVANSNTGEYAVTCHKVLIQGYQPGANNNGMVPNSGNVYIMRTLGPSNSNSGGPSNRADSGAMVFVLPPAGQVILPADEFQGPTISPYRYSLDADNNNDGGLVTLLGAARG